MMINSFYVISLTGCKGKFSARAGRWLFCLLVFAGDFELVLLLSLDFLKFNSLFSLPSSGRTGRFFLMHQKETKKCLPSAIAEAAKNASVFLVLLNADGGGFRLLEWKATEHRMLGALG